MPDKEYTLDEILAEFGNNIKNENAGQDEKTAVAVAEKPDTAQVCEPGAETEPVSEPETEPETEPEIEPETEDEEQNNSVSEPAREKRDENAFSQTTGIAAAVLGFKEEEETQDKNAPETDEEAAGKAVLLGYSTDVYPLEYEDRQIADFSLKAYEKAYKEQQREIKQARKAKKQKPEQIENQQKLTDVLIAQDEKELPEQDSKAAQPEPQIDPHRLLARLSAFSKTLSRRTLAAFLMCIPLCYLSLAPQLMLPLPSVIHYFDASYIFVFLQILFLTAVTVCGIDVFVNGIRGLIYLRPSGDTLISFSVISSLLYCVAIIASPAQSVFLPLCALPALATAFSMLGDRESLTANARSVRCAIRLTKPETMICTQDGYDGSSYIRSAAAGMEPFYKNIGKRDITAKAASVYAPVAILAAIAVAIAAAVKNGGAGYFLWSFSALCAVAPAFGLFISSTLPYGRISKRMFRAGAASAGSEGLFEFTGRAPVVLSDRDIFPGDSIVLSGYRLIGRGGRESVIGYTASILDEAGCALGRQFVRLAAEEYIPRSRVGELEFTDNGGISAEINGDRVMVGTAEFMNKVGIHTPEDITLKTAVFCAINSELCGVFAVKYNISPRVERALAILIRAKRRPVLCSRDFNVTPEMIESKLDIREGSLAYPSVQERISLNNPDRAVTASGVLFLREGADAAAQTIEAGRRYKKTIIINTALSLAASVSGIFLVAFFAYSGGDWITLASPLNLIAYMALWTAPVLLASGWVSKF